MTLPVMTAERRADALAKAKAAVKARAEVKESVRSGGLTVADVLGRAKTSDVLGGLRVTALLESLPGVGKVRARQIMARLGIAEKRRVRGLTARQRDALEQEFSAVPA